MQSKEAEMLVSLFGFFKQLMRENIAFSHTLKDIHAVNWRPDYRSYLEMATEATDAAFRDFERAAAAQSDLGPAVARLAETL